MKALFNSACPYHMGKCKCSYKRRCTARQCDVLSEGQNDHDDNANPRASMGTISQRIHPISEVGMRISRLIKCIEGLGLDSTPIVFLPSRIGESEMLDIAAEALIHLSMGSGYDRSARSGCSPVRSKYAQSVGLVRKQLSTWNGESGLDTLVGTISLLGVIDVLTRDDRRSKSQTVHEFFTHWNGISNLLLCSAPSAAGSEIARASMTLAACSTFAIPCFQGTHSPFEVTHWLESEPADLHPTTPELRSLNVCSHQLSVRLPRLIAMIRQLRTQYTSDVAYEAIMQAKALYECQEPAAERWILGRTKVRATTLDIETTARIPTAMEFASVRDMTAAVMYWQSRIIATRLHNVIRASVGAGHCEDIDTTAEELLLADNIRMAWPYGKSTGACATAPFTMGFVCVWLICRSIVNFQGLPTSSLADWILRTLDVCHGGWAVGPTVMDLNAASDVLIGGPLVGHLADAVRSLPSVRQA